MKHHEILDMILDSRDATAGGGSASALAGAMAAGMAGMVARLSVGKEYGLADEQYLEIAEQADRLAADLCSGCSKDREAYLLIKDAYGLPKQTPEEKAVRSKAIRQAGIEAARVPMENAEKCAGVGRLCKLLSGKSNPNAASDLKAAEMLSATGLEGCILNIEVNLSLIKDEEVKAGFEKKARELRKA